MTSRIARIRQSFAQQSLSRTFAIAFGAGVFLALLGPFGSAAAPLWQRLIYWLALLVGGTGIGVTASGVICALFDPDDRRPYLMATVTAVAMTPPATLLVYGVSRWMFEGQFRFGSLLELAGPVLLVSLAMTFINALADRRPALTHAGAPSDTTPSRFLERLPPRLRGAEIHAVEAEDHYLRLHTSKGSDLILMRLSDAIAELEGIEGAQVHRSWWVARRAVQSARRLDGRAVLALPGNVEAPVSRNFARALKAEGWF